jgi:hypothetical protein
VLLSDGKSAPRADVSISSDVVTRMAAINVAATIIDGTFTTA